MNLTRERRMGTGELQCAVYDDLATHEEGLEKVARRLDNIEAVLGGWVKTRPGSDAPEDRVVFLSALKFGLIVAGVFLAGIASSVAVLALLSS